MYSLALSLSRSQRLPTAQELYADGIHLATNTYEIGNADLKQETSQNVDLTLRKHAGDARFTVSVFFNQTKNYIYADTLYRHEALRLTRSEELRCGKEGVSSCRYRWCRDN